MTDNQRSVYEDFPRWSPDASKLAYIRYRSAPRIYILDLENAQHRRLTDNRRDSYQETTTGPAWSPVGAALFYASRAAGEFDIYRHDLASGKVTRLTEHPAVDLAPDVSPNGRKLLFYSNRAGTFDVWTADIS